jgi:hypothetical protein
MVVDLAERLLSYEAAKLDSSEKTSAVYQVSEKLRRPLSTLAGASGFRALLSRALTLAKARSPCLSRARIKADGSLDGLNEVHDDKTAEADAILIAQLIDLLVTFIGGNLTMRLVRDVWPDLPVQETSSGEQTQND